MPDDTAAYLSEGIATATEATVIRPWTSHYETLSTAQEGVEADSLKILL